MIVNMTGLNATYAHSQQEADNDLTGAARSWWSGHRQALFNIAMSVHTLPDGKYEICLRDYATMKRDAMPGESLYNYGYRSGLIHAAGFFVTSS